MDLTRIDILKTADGSTYIVYNNCDIRVPRSHTSDQPAESIAVFGEVRLHTTLQATQALFNAMQKTQISGDTAHYNMLLEALTRLDSAAGEVKSILDQFAHVRSVEPDHTHQIYLFFGNAIQMYLYGIRCSIIVAELSIWTKTVEDTKELEDCAKLLVDATAETVRHAKLNGVDVTEAEETLNIMRTALLQPDSN